VAGYCEFDKRGLLIRKRSHRLDSLDQDIEKLIQMDCNDYDNNDYDQKSHFKISKNTPGLIHKDLLVNCNIIYWDSCDEINKIEKEGNAFIYKYILEKGRITQELAYHRAYDEKSNLPKEDNLFTKTNYLYDNKGNLIQKKITPGAHGNRIGVTYPMERVSLPLGEESCIVYEYDAQNRLIKKTAKAYNKQYGHEIYSYHPQKGYLETMKKYVPGPGPWAWENLHTYNEYGDMIAFVNGGAQVQMNISKYMYFDYEYDQYKNWIKCTMYIDADKKEPIVFGKRKIEYYDEIKK
jgi:hypothetical protein